MLIRTAKTGAIMAFLKKELLTNQNIIGVIENMPEAEIYVDDEMQPTGVLVKKDGYMHYIYTESDSFIDNVCENYLKEGFYGFSGVEGELAEKIRSRYLLGWESRCTLYYMPKENLDISLKKNPTERIRLEDAETVDRFYQYRGPETLDVIKRDISKRPSSAIYINGEIVCWVLIHDDNSMGIMYTKEAHRRKGYAIDVTIDLASQIIEADKIPFIQIVKGNGMSPGLANKCGFVEIGKADWFGIVVGVPKEIRDGLEQSRKQFEKTLSDAQHEIADRSSSHAGMFNLLYNFKYQASEVEGVSFVKAEVEEEKSLWYDIAGSKLRCSTDKQTGKKQLLKALEDSGYSLFLLMKDGKPVAASMTQKDGEEDCGVYLLSTLPEYDKEEYYKLLLSETMNYEKNRNCFFMVAQAPSRYKHLYEELAFKASENH